MRCPGCTLEMVAEPYEGNYGRQLEIDVCHHCNGLWFDGRESLLLSPGSTLNLFRSMAARQAAARAPHGPDKRCPRCAEPLRETHDLQRTTRYTYFACAEHGRFITFFHFLHEKNLLRRPTPRQLAQLKAQVRQVQCSNCGAAIDLATQEACGYCQAPVSVLAPEALQEQVARLRARADRHGDPARVAAELAMIRAEEDRKARVEALGAAGGTLATDLVLTGLRAFLLGF